MKAGGKTIPPDLLLQWSCTCALAQIPPPCKAAREGNRGAWYPDGIQVGESHMQSQELGSTCSRWQSPAPVSIDKQISVQSMKKCCSSRELLFPPQTSHLSTLAGNFPWAIQGYLLPWQQGALTSVLTIWDEVSPSQTDIPKNYYFSLNGVFTYT